MRQEIIDGPDIVGSSEIGVVLGLSPYQTPLELWQVKVGDAPRFAGNEQTVWGHEVEPAIRSWYANHFGDAVYVPPTSLIHPEHSFLRATPDGLVLRDPSGPPAAPENWARGFEAKKASWRVAHYWGEPGTDEVPSWYIAQAQQNMAVTGLGTWDVAVSLGGEPPVIYGIDRDEEFIAALVEAAREFIGLVARRTPPAIDGSEAWSAYLAKRHAFAREELKVASVEDERNAAALKALRTAIRELEERQRGVENVLKESIGGYAGLKTSIGTISWKPTKPRTSIDWESVAVNLASDYGVGDAALAARVAANTKQGAPTRPFNTPRAWSKEG